MGGTKIRVAATENLETPQIVSKKIIKNKHDFDEYINQIVDFAKGLGKISGVGISTNGALNKEKTMFIGDILNTPEKRNKQPVEILKNSLNCDIFMENDGVAAALGETSYGRYNFDEFLYIIWGTGIGGAYARRENNKIMINRVDWFKHFQELEEECGGNFIEKQFGKLPHDLREEEWGEVTKNFKKHLMKLIEVFKIKNVIFGGGIAINQFNRIRDIAPNLHLASFGDDAGLYGAFALLSRRRNDQAT